MQSIKIRESALSNNIIRNAYSILSGNLYLLDNKNENKTLVITSCNPKEGKTALSSALAATLAEMGHKTLLADLNFRDMKRKTEANMSGISHYLKGEKEINEIICETNIEKLFFAGPGEYIENPMPYLCSEKLDTFVRDMREEYDYVVIDTPSLECVTDAVIISVKADAAILVAKMGHTTLDDIKKAQEQFEKVNAKLMGVVLNRVSRKAYRKRFSSFNYFSRKNKSVNKEKEREIFIRTEEKILIKRSTV